MQGADKCPQSPRHVTKWRSLICAFASVLFGLASVFRLTAGDPAQELRRVKVERKPKLIPNGPGEKTFDVTRHIVPLSAIQRSVPKDSIPALVDPSFVTASELGKLLDETDRVLGVYLKGEAKAFPIRILNWHELVNTEVGGQPILVTW